MNIKELENDGRRWFSINGQDNNTGVCFFHDTYGLTTDGTILDSDGYPLTPGDTTEISVRAAIEAIDNTNDIDMEADVVDAIDISEQAMNNRFDAIEAQIAKALPMLQDIKVLDTRIKELESRQDKPDIEPFELEINTPVKLPREIAVAFSGGNIGDYQTMIIEAVYTDGLLTLQSIGIPDDNDYFYPKLCSWLLISLQDLVTMDPWRGGDYDHIFRITGLTWVDDRWIEDNQEAWSPGGEDIKQENEATRKATGAGGEI